MSTKDDGNGGSGYPGPRIAPSAPAMATLENLYKDLDFLSETVSNRTRVLDGAVIAIWWGSLVGKEAIPSLGPADLAAPACLAAISLLVDFLQYAVAYVASRGLLYRLERDKKTGFEYDLKSLSYKFRGACFYFKQMLMVVAVAWLIVELARVVI